MIEHGVSALQESSQYLYRTNATEVSTMFLIHLGYKEGFWREHVFGILRELRCFICESLRRRQSLFSSRAGLTALTQTF